MASEQRWRGALLLAPGVLLVGSLLWLGSLESGGPAHADLVLTGGIPATLTVPNPDDAAYSGGLGLPRPRPRGERPPAVLLIHGFSADRMGMSVLARSLAVWGYAVLTIDLRGHGENRNVFERDFVRGSLTEDLAAGVDFLRTTPYVDGSRISVMGHSMGASASFDYATRDSALDAAVMISGGSRSLGPHRPPNAFFIYATGDPGRIAERSQGLVAELSGVEEPEAGKRYGSFRNATASGYYEVPGADHITVLYSSTTVREIVSWLDATYGVERPGEAAVDDPRLAAAGLCALAFALLIPGIGTMIGRLAPARDVPPAAGAGHSIVFTALGLLVTLPFFAAGTPGKGIPLDVADVIVMHLFITGVLLWVAFSLRGGNPGAILDRPVATFTAAAVGLLAIFVCLLPFGVIGHRLTLTPERTLAFVVLAVLLVPFTSVFHFGLRRGSVLRATLFSSAGRLLVLGILALGALTGVSPGVVMLMLPVLAVLFVLVEILSIFIYRSGGNVTAAAIVEAGWLAWVFAAVLPIRI